MRFRIDSKGPVTIGFAGLATATGAVALAVGCAASSDSGGGSGGSIGNSNGGMSTSSGGTSSSTNGGTPSTSGGTTSSNGGATQGGTTQGGATQGAGGASVSGATGSSGATGQGGAASGNGGAQPGGGASSSGGAATGGASVGGATASGGDSAAAGAAGASCVLPTAAQACSGAVPKKAHLVDFATYATDGTWGKSSSGDLTGGTSKFQGSGVTALTLATMGTAPTTLHVTGTITKSSYAGFVLWFGPCVNAASITNEASIATGDPIVTTPTTGLSVSVGGSLGGTRLKIQAQTTEDYPVDTANTKGACLYTACTTKYSECAGPTDTLTTIPATPTATALPWASFVSGKPVAATTGNGLLGLQFQFECVADTDCTLDVQFGGIDFST